MDIRQPSAPRPVSAGIVVGIVLVSIWMAVSLLFAFLLGAGDVYVCETRDPACLDRYAARWAMLLGLVALSILVTIFLWVGRSTRPWGLVTGILGTGGAVIAFTMIHDVPL